MLKSIKNSEKRFRIINAVIMVIICVLIAYPLFYVLIASITDPTIVSSGKLLLFPEKIYLDGYKKIFTYTPLATGYLNTIKYTVLGTAVSLIATIPCAYALSRKDMFGRKFWNILFTFTMFFNGGIIPLYLIVNKLGIYDTTWAMILPGAVSVYNLIVCRSFFESGVPIEILEAARIDGCSDWKFFFKIVIPISKAIIAVMVLFYATALWNQYFNALMFLGGQDKMPLQVILRNLVLSNQASSVMAGGTEMIERARLAEQLKYGVIVVSSLPLLVIYPFVQKYFVKGVMIGAVKG